MMQKVKKEKSPFQIYMERVNQYELLDKDRERELSKQIMAGDEQARQSLIKSNLLLVVKLAYQYSHSDDMLMDVIQEGNLGLLRAASKFDYRYNVRFSTYALWWIKHTINQYLLSRKYQIRLPHRKQQIMIKIKNAFVQVTKRLGRRPSMRELAEEVGMQWDDITTMIHAIVQVLPFDELDTMQEEMSIDEVFSDTRYHPERQLMIKVLQEETLQALKKLEPKEYLVMQRQLTLGDKHATLKKIGEDLNMSQESIRQIKLRALQKLRNSLLQTMDLYRNG